MMWTVPQSWKGETCFILAGGPSLKGFDAKILDGRKVITINDSWRLRAETSINYFCDHQWFVNQISYNRWNLGATRSFCDQIYKGFWVTTSPSYRDHPLVRCLRLTGERGLETEPTGLRHGSNSGYQAIGLAYHLGVKRIVLLGYDMRVEGAQTHWHVDGNNDAARFSQTLALSMLPHFESLAEPLAAVGVEILNATPGSALKVWPFVSLKDVLK